MPFLGIHGYAGIVSYVLVTAGGYVEKRRFSTVGVAHKGHADDVAAFLRHVGKSLVQALLFFHITGKRLEVLIGNQGLPGFLFRNNIYKFCLFPAERNLISNYFIFDGVLERGVKDDLDLLPLYESHLYQAFAETSMTVHTHNHGLFAGPEFR